MRMRKTGNLTIGKFSYWRRNKIRLTDDHISVASAPTRRVMPMKMNLRAMLCFAVAAAAVWLGTGCATTSSTTAMTTDSCCTPEASHSLGQAHSVRLGTNQIYYLTAGKG